MKKPNTEQVYKSNAADVEKKIAEYYANNPSYSGISLALEKPTVTGFFKSISGVNDSKSAFTKPEVPNEAKEAAAPGVKSEPAKSSFIKFFQSLTGISDDAKPVVNPVNNG